MENVARPEARLSSGAVGFSASFRCDGLFWICPCRGRMFVEQVLARECELCTQSCNTVFTAYGCVILVTMFDAVTYASERILPFFKTKTSAADHKELMQAASSFTQQLVGDCSVRSQFIQARLRVWSVLNSSNFLQLVAIVPQ